METFESLVEAVKENNVINDASWKDWQDAKHIQDVYGELENDERKIMYEAMLDECIYSEGEYADPYLALIRAMDYGI